MKVNKYLPFALIYFFINAVALPFGLTYMALLAPLFYIWVLLVRKTEILLPFFLLLMPLVLLHLLVVGVDNRTYFISLLNIILVYIFCQAAYTFFKVCTDPEKIFRVILVLNFLLCLVAIPLYFTPYADFLWLEQTISAGMKLYRLKLFTYEPSYYALLFTPIFFFYLLQYLFRQNRLPGFLLIPMIFLPYVLSFSFGVMTAIILSGLLTWMVYFTRLTRKKRVLNMAINTGAMLVTGMTILVLFFRNNALFGRVRNIFSGEDTSGNGRTTDAFILADKLLKETSEYWGVGIGQIKLVGEHIIRGYYLYYRPQTVAIPNAAAETLAIFGWAGFSLRMFIEIFLFFQTRVWTNYYRLLLFIFMFIYQFTGSFITNGAEYVIWILAFVNVFPQYNVVKKSESRI
jgi:hypothetical protein